MPDCNSAQIYPTSENLLIKNVHPHTDIDLKNIIVFLCLHVYIFFAMERQVTALACSTRTHKIRYFGEIIQEIMADIKKPNILVSVGGELFKATKPLTHEYKFRIGTTQDIFFLKKMLYEAVFWNSESKRIPMEELFKGPAIKKILDRWGSRTGDFSIIASDTEHTPVAAVWYRFWTDDNHSYGYIDENTPELGIAVLKEHRRKGLGSFLMRQALKHAKKEDIEQISLSVDPNNPALTLYKDQGFKKVTEVSTSWTMVKIL